MKQKNILTEKQTRIVQLICMEYTNQRIADEFELSKRTVEDCREKIKRLQQNDIRFPVFRPHSQ